MSSCGDKTCNQWPGASLPPAHDLLFASLSGLQDLDDGAYHEDDEQAEKFVVRVQDIVAVAWATAHSLSLGNNDYTPALLLHVIKPTSGVLGSMALLFVTPKHLLAVPGS